METLIGLIILLAVIALIAAKTIKIVPQSEVLIIERFGRYHKTAEAGPNIIIPFIDNVRARVDLREQTMDVQPQSVITRDNVTIRIDTVVFFQITEPRNAIYEIQNLENGNNEEIANAAALAMKNMLGLTCDPVAGLVEVPCIKRNVSGAVNAIISSQMAMAGIKSAIPVDEVFETMGRIGKLIPACLRETSLEGLAAAPSALRASVKNS